jgi:hypothetical protein
MESTALQLFGTSTDLTPLEEMIRAEMANDERAYNFEPARYRIASQVARFQNILNEDELLREIRAVILMSRIVRALWDNRAGGDNDNADGGKTPPRCVSLGGVQGEWRDADGVSRIIPCDTCPYNRWGSEQKRDETGAIVRGKGKACKEMRRFLILIEGHDQPAILTLPPTSIKPFDRFANALRSEKPLSAYWAVLTRVGLDKADNAAGQQYAVATFELAGRLDESAVATVIALRRQFEAALGIAPEYEEYVDQNGAPKDPDDPDQW